MTQSERREYLIRHLLKEDIRLRTRKIPDSKQGQEELLASCYRECLKLAADTGVTSIAFCCLSTGVFRFPQQRAAEIAVDTVKKYLENDSRIKKVIFNVFKDGAALK